VSVLDLCFKLALLGRPPSCQSLVKSVPAPRCIHNHECVVPKKREVLITEGRPRVTHHRPPVGCRGGTCFSRHHPPICEGFRTYPIKAAFPRSAGRQIRESTLRNQLPLSDASGSAFSATPSETLRREGLGVPAELNPSLVPFAVIFPTLPHQRCSRRAAASWRKPLLETGSSGICTRCRGQCLAFGRPGSCPCVDRI